jgi:hypothetical protein
MSISKVLLTGMALGLTNAAPYQPSLSGSYTKFQYAGLSKHSPSHAQQKRDSKKAKNKGRG